MIDNSMRQLVDDSAQMDNSMNNSMYFEVKDGKKTNDQNFSMRIPDKDMDQSQQNHSAHNDAYRSKLLSRAEQQEYNDF